MEVPESCAECKQPGMKRWAEKEGTGEMILAVCDGARLNRKAPVIYRRSTGWIYDEPPEWCPLGKQ